LVEGRLLEAVQIFESALKSAETAVGRNSAAAALPAGYLAALYYERNDLESVQRVTADRSALLMESGPVGSVLRYTRATACLCTRRGDIASALVILTEARELASARGWLRLRAGCDAEAVRLHLHAGRLDAAGRTVDELLAALPEQLPSPMGSFIETWNSCCIARARLYIARGEAERAVPLLEELWSMLDAAGMRHLEACASVLLALAHERSGRRDAALAALARALSFAQTVGMISSFVDEGTTIFELIQVWRRAGAAAIDAGFVDRLFAAFAPDALPSRPPAPRAPAASELLSSRETEILQHISRGLSNKEIARALRVAPETIKWHLKNIFEKLNVGSRVEAVQIGLGLSSSALAR